MWFQKDFHGMKSTISCSVSDGRLTPKHSFDMGIYRGEKATGFSIENRISLANQRFFEFYTHLSMKMSPQKEQVETDSVCVELGKKIGKWTFYLLKDSDTLQDRLDRFLGCIATVSITADSEAMDFDEEYRISVQLPLLGRVEISAVKNEKNGD